MEKRKTKFGFLVSLMKETKSTAANMFQTQAVFLYVRLSKLQSINFHSFRRIPIHISTVSGVLYLKTHIRSMFTVL